MSSYKRRVSDNCRKHIKKIRSSHDLKKRLKTKMREILADPHHYKPLRNVLKNHFRTHIGSYVLIFEVQEMEKTVVFHSFLHHDEAYK
ncbi:MAG: type II toxin-antitoxin system RelE/ParE family toxin [Nitrospinaceae bacterium]